MAHTQQRQYENRPNLKVVNEAKERISKRARSKLMKALSHLSDEKLIAASARDLSGIAKDMSAVVKSMEDGPIATDQKANGPTFVFYSPQTRREEVFDVVAAKE